MNQPADEAPSGNRFALLCRNARAGDKSALGELLSNYRNYLLLIANEDLDPTIQTKVAPSDIVQQSMLAAQQDILQFQGETEAEFRGWIRKILKNDVQDLHRKYRLSQQRDVSRERRIDDSQNVQFNLAAENVNTPGTDAHLREQARLLNEAIGKLPDEYQTVVRLRNWEERTFVEIGEQLDCSSDAARKLWYRAVLKLEATIRQIYPGLQSTIIQMMNPSERIDEQEKT